MQPRETWFLPFNRFLAAILQFPVLVHSYPEDYRDNQLICSILLQQVTSIEGTVLACSGSTTHTVCRIIQSVGGAQILTLATYTHWSVQGLVSDFSEAYCKAEIGNHAQVGYCIVDGSLFLPL